MAEIMRRTPLRTPNVCNGGGGTMEGGVENGRRIDIWRVRGAPSQTTGRTMEGVKREMYMAVAAADME